MKVKSMNVWGVPTREAVKGAKLRELGAVQSFQRGRCFCVRYTESFPFTVCEQQGDNQAEIRKHAV